MSDTPYLAALNERIRHDSRFQADIGDRLAVALAFDPEGLSCVIDLARQIWHGDELPAWLLTPQARWQDRSPLAMCAAGLADDVMDVLEGMELQ